jgi:proteic killer suppression protein
MPRRASAQRRTAIRSCGSLPATNWRRCGRIGRVNQHSIRINQQYRVCFVWTEIGPAEVEIVDYH